MNDLHESQKFETKKKKKKKKNGCEEVRKGAVAQCGGLTFKRGRCRQEQRVLNPNIDWINKGKIVAGRRFLERAPPPRLQKQGVKRATLDDKNSSM